MIKHNQSNFTILCLKINNFSHFKSWLQPIKSNIVLSWVVHGPVDRMAHKFVRLLSANPKCVLWPVDQGECSIYVAFNLQPIKYNIILSWVIHGPADRMAHKFVRLFVTESQMCIMASWPMRLLDIKSNTISSWAELSMDQQTGWLIIL